MYIYINIYILKAFHKFLSHYAQRFSSERIPKINTNKIGRIVFIEIKKEILMGWMTQFNTILIKTHSN